MTLKITRFEASNYKRLVAVDITPESNLVVLSGRNRQGKTSVLDGIFAVLKGAKIAKETSQPIRDGQDTAWVRLEIGEDRNNVKYVATRRWSKDDVGTLEIKAGDGVRYSSPQQILDSLFSLVSFDPQSFLDLTAKEQVNELVRALGPSLPFDPALIDEQRQDIYDRRTNVGREVTKLEGQLAQYPDLDPSVPSDEVSATDILAELNAATTTNRRIQDAHAEQARLEDALARAKDALDAAQTAFDQAGLAVYEHQQTVIEHLPAPVDVDQITARLNSVEETNRVVRAHQHRAAVAAELANRKEERARLTLALQDIDRTKAEGIAAAKFPVPELSFDQSGVLYDGRALSQASTEEQYRAAFGVALASNPQLRVCRIDRGESIDQESLTVIEKLADEYQMQVWLSRVTDGQPLGVLIEDGHAVEAEVLA